MVRSRLATFGLLVLLSALGALLLANFATGGRLFLQARFAVASRLAPYCRVAELNVAGASGLRMFLHPDDKVFTFRIMATRQWEPNETYWMSTCVQAGDTFVDVGANVGYYTLIASRLVGESGRVYAFEPDPTVFAILQKNVRLNHLRNVVLVPMAVSDQTGSVRLFLADENKGDHRIYETDEQRPSVAVEATTLDDFFEGDDRGVDFVKIDTQGAEGQILRGMHEVIVRNRDLVMAVEFWPYGLHESGFDPVQLLELLRSYDFVFFDLRAGGTPPQNIDIVDAPQILRRFTVKNEWFTNLLLVRGHAELRRHGLRALHRSKILNTRSRELDTAYVKWLEEVAAGTDEGPGDAAGVPAHLQTLLQIPEHDRTAAQTKALRNHFHSVTPLLAVERDELEHARRAMQAFREGLIAHGGLLVR